MSLKATFSHSFRFILEFWNERNFRERKILLIALAVVITALIYALLIAPALEGRTQLNRTLPKLRQQVAELQSLSREAANLSTEAAPAKMPLSRETIDASLERKGLKPQSVTLSGDIVRIQLTSVSFTALLEWLDEVQKTALLSVFEANISALAQLDAVNATLSLRQQKSE